MSVVFCLIFDSLVCVLGLVLGFFFPLKKYLVAAFCPYLHVSLRLALLCCVRGASANTSAAPQVLPLIILTPYLHDQFTYRRPPSSNQPIQFVAVAIRVFLSR